MPPRRFPSQSSFPGRRTPSSPPAARSSPRKTNSSLPTCPPTSWRSWARLARSSSTWAAARAFAPAVRAANSPSSQQPGASAPGFFPGPWRLLFSSSPPDIVFPANTHDQPRHGGLVRPPLGTETCGGPWRDYFDGDGAACCGRRAFHLNQHVWSGAGQVFATATRRERFAYRLVFAISGMRTV